jgi:hypothetical protein
MPSAITLGVPTLNDLTDVVITAAAAGDILRHDGANWVDYAWLGLGDISKISRGNPLIRRSPLDIANPGLLETRLMRDPNYLTFTSKILLDFKLTFFKIIF